MTVTRFQLPGTPVEVVATDASEGDRRPPAEWSEAFAAAVGERPWSWLSQKHSADVLEVTRPGEHAGAPGDGLVTSVPEAMLVVLGADCGLVALGSPEGVAGVAHAGWRGLLGGVVEAAVSEMRRLGASRVLAWRGACIHPCCYEVGEDLIEEAEAKLGPAVRSATSAGAPALDLRLGIRAALELAGAHLVGEEPSCTGCSDRWFSWRARGDTGRQCVGTWRPA